MLSFKQYVESVYYHVGPKNLDTITPASKQKGYIRSVIDYRKKWGKVTGNYKDIKAALTHPRYVHMYDSIHDARRFLQNNNDNNENSIYRVELDKKHVKRDKTYFDHPVTRKTIDKNNFKEIPE